MHFFFHFGYGALKICVLYFSYLPIKYEIFDAKSEKFQISASVVEVWKFNDIKYLQISIRDFRRPAPFPSLIYTRTSIWNTRIPSNVVSGKYDIANLKSVRRLRILSRYFDFVRPYFANSDNIKFPNLCFPNKIKGI